MNVGHGGIGIFFLVSPCLLIKMSMKIKIKSQVGRRYRRWFTVFNRNHASVSPLIKM